MRGERRQSGLTPREREVLDLVRVGLTNEEIAERLGISTDTAKYHVSQILTKLGVASREEAAAWQPSEPHVSWWRLGAWGLAAKVVLVAAAGTAVIGVAALGWAVVQSRTGDSSEQVAAATTPVETPFPTPSPLTSLAVAWLDSTPAPFATGSPPPTPDPSVLAVAECRGDQLHGAFTGSAFEGGYTFIDFVIANVSPDPCRLSGAPASFQYLRADGQLLFSGTQAKCNPQSCSQAVLAPNGVVVRRAVATPQPQAARSSGSRGTIRCPTPATAPARLTRYPWDCRAAVP